jgi:predicted enzyme related to lactoylglutathione lyase
MKRMHVHVSVEDLARSIGFYSSLFGLPIRLTQVEGMMAISAEYGWRRLAGLHR